MNIRWLAAFSLIAFGATAHAGSQDFVLVNKAGAPIQFVYISPADDEEWGEDVLGSEDVLDEDAETAITFEGDDEVCVWDIKADFEEKYEPDVAIFHDIDLCKANKVTIIHEDGKDYAEVE